MLTVLHNNIFSFVCKFKILFSSTKGRFGWCEYQAAIQALSLCRFTFLNDALQRLLDILKDGNPLSVCIVGQVAPAPVVVLDGKLGEILACNPSPGLYVLNTQHHVAAQTDEVGGLTHGAQTPRVSQYGEQQHPGIVHGAGLDGY